MQHNSNKNATSGLSCESIAFPLVLLLIASLNYAGRRVFPDFTERLRCKLARQRLVVRGNLMLCHSEINCRLEKLTQHLGTVCLFLCRFFK